MGNSTSRTIRILITDDNRAIHEDFRKIFATDEGSRELAAAEAVLFDEKLSDDTDLCFEIDSAFQGQEGFELVQAARDQGRDYDIAFVDMRMPPGWDGVETIQNLWQADPNLQVVICTAFSDYTWSQIVQRLGKRDNLLILKKPFDNIEVSQIAAALTEKRRLLREIQGRLTNLEELVEERTLDIRRAHEESERLLTSISSLLIGIDDQGVIQRWNHTAEQVLGIRAEAAIGQEFHALDIEWYDADSLCAQIVANIVDESIRVETGLRDRDGTSRTLELLVCPVRQEHHGNGVLILGTDTTERRGLEQQLHQAQKLESVGQLAAGVAHEINTPMQYIGDNLQYVKASWNRLTPMLEVLESMQGEPDVPAETLDNLCDKLSSIKLKKMLKSLPEALEDAEEGVTHVSRIVKAMKEFSHPGTEERTPVDLNHALESTIVVAKNEWKYVADIEMELDAELPLVSGFGGELNQVFLNLLVNAAHAISAVTDGGANGKGTIRISTRHDQDTVTVMIEDSGGGIPPEVGKKVFDPFFTTKDVGKGTGQGLAIAHQVVVKKHDGSIWFESEPGVGTTFFVELPVEEGASLARDVSKEPVCI